MTHRQSVDRMEDLRRRVGTAVALEKAADCAACGQRIEVLRVAVEGQHLACWMRINPLVTVGVTA